MQTLDWSSVEMVLKLLGRVPACYYDLQTQWKDKSDGSFTDFDRKTVAGVTFQQQFALPRGGDFPLAALYETIHNELAAGRFVIVGLTAGDDWHNWVIYDEDRDGDFSQSRPMTVLEVTKPPPQHRVESRDNH